MVISINLLVISKIAVTGMTICSGFSGVLICLNFTESLCPSAGFHGPAALYPQGVRRIRKPLKAATAPQRGGGAAPPSWLRPALSQGIR